ncbi:hypothetical protein [Serinicoccus chungangensis]|uniref:hypothetical protein n=1 Tax=Serinicoccus chungangensis TaxID=767452 RepID=UPI00128F50E9|nr:hypothetical protein [Serinicoccus chungangensis]
MNGQLALVAALAAIGGRWLRGGSSASIPELSGSNSAFQYVGSFTATLPPHGLLRRTSTATSPAEWLTGLRSRGVTDLWLVTDLPAAGSLPPHVASGFSNSGTWALLATGASAPTVWAFGWQVGDRTAPDSRIWSVSAHGSSAEGLRAPQVGVTEARTALQVALHDIRGFAQQFDELHRWASWFTKAESLLTDPTPAAPYHQDLLPPDADLERRQLAAAVVQGWVFGGMGSWNDGGPADPGAQREYERVGAHLYSALLTALPAATNGA